MTSFRYGQETQEDALNRDAEYLERSAISPFLGILYTINEKYVALEHCKFVITTNYGGDLLECLNIWPGVAASLLDEIVSIWGMQANIKTYYEAIRQMKKEIRRINSLYRYTKIHPKLKDELVDTIEQYTTDIICLCQKAGLRLHTYSKNKAEDFKAVLDSRFIQK